MSFFSLLPSPADNGIRKRSEHLSIYPCFSKSLKNSTIINTGTSINHNKNYSHML